MVRPRPSIQQRNRTRRVVLMLVALLVGVGITSGVVVALTHPTIVLPRILMVQQVECSARTDRTTIRPCPAEVAASLAPLLGSSWLGSDVPTQASARLVDLGWRVEGYSYQLPNTLKLQLVQNSWAYQVLKGYQLWNISVSGQPMRSLATASGSGQLLVNLSSSAGNWQPPQPLPSELHQPLLLYLNFAHSFPSQLPTTLTWDEPQRLSGVLQQTPTTIILDPAEISVNLERLRLILQGWDPSVATASQQLDLRFKLPVLRINP